MEGSILSEVDDTSILRPGLPTPLCLSSQMATGLSPLAPAQRAGAQRLCALALTGAAGRPRVGRLLKVDRQCFRCGRSSQAGPEAELARSMVGIRGRTYCLHRSASATISS